MINSSYFRLFCAYFLSSIGDWLYRLALPILLFQQTHSPLVMATAYAMTFLPFVCITPFGGVIADRLDRRKILITGDLFACGLAILLGLTIMSLLQHLVMAYLLVFVIAAVNSLYYPAFQSFLPMIVSKKKLAKANSYMLSADNLMLLLGPLCGGAAIVWLGSLTAIYIDAVSFLLSAGLIMTITPIVDGENKIKCKMKIVNIWSDLKKGFVYTVHHPVIKYGCILFVFANFGLQVFYANFMYYLIDYLHLNASEVGITLAITGVGAVVGSIIAPYFMKTFSEGRIILTCCVLEGLFALTLLLAKNALTVGIYWGLASLFGSITVVTYFTLRQQLIPSEFLGRTVAVTRLISYSAIPVASILGGWLLKQTQNIHVLIWLCGLVMIINGCLGWLTPLNNKFPKVQPATN